MSPANWLFTRISEHYDCALPNINRTDGELAIVTARTSEFNWYALTTRRIIGETNNASFDVPAAQIVGCDFGRNAKGYGSQQFALATVTCRDGSQVQLEFETGRAWMAPQYYMSWWVRKYVILDVLKFDPTNKTMA